ncbi:hypothetical protein ADIARSV_0011 [Arcticibacter svalbardensis MN12-7]|uniref:Uncharacterized protein n=2 Tax=Arcticibacter TaxID=1288026 RepID=R9GYM1_9SPHI|nr:hypothetical protein ADIARSV_0011 [Arcticibacter svalbardensis MN12-7]
MAGYKIDLKPQELDEVLNLYIAIWEFFKTDPQTKVKAITESQFDQLQIFNINLVGKDTFSGGETTSVMLSAIIQRIGTHPTFQKMGIQKRGALIVGVKSTIECFQELAS